MASAALRYADALGAADPDAIFGEQVFVFVDVPRHGLDDALHAIEPARRRFEREPADAEITGHHPLAGDVFVNLHDLFALAEAVEEHGHRAEIDGVRAEPHEVRSDAGQFGEQHADVLRALGNFEPDELFGRQAVAQIVRERSEIIDAVGERDRLRIRLRFAGFFDAGVQVADLRIGLQHDFAVQLENHAQHAVRRGVLRPHIEDHRWRGAGRGFDGGRRRRCAAHLSDILRWDNLSAADILPTRRASRCGEDSDGPRSECRKDRNSRARASRP